MKPAFEEALRRQNAAGLLRVEEVLEKPDARRLRTADGRAMVDFSSNSYLGLHQKVARRSAMRFLKGHAMTSAGSSRMVSGTCELHRRLETQLADFVGAESAAVFGSGFLCCMGVVSTLAGGRDQIFFDEKIHASIRAGIVKSQAESTPYHHADADDLRHKLSSAHSRGRIFIVTDGLFSMAGDFAPLNRLARLAARHGAWLIVDDAHGIGALGRRGRGTFEMFGIPLAPRHVLIGTLSKTLGSYGGFVAGEKSVIQFLKTRSKEFIYTTAAPPFQIIAALEALAVVRSAEGARLRRRLGRNIDLLGQLLGRTLQSPIVPVPVAGGPDAVLAAARRLRTEGCFAVGMRYPTVSRGEEMIRVSLTAAHTAFDIRRLAAALRTAISP